MIYDLLLKNLGKLCSSMTKMWFVSYKINDTLLKIVNKIKS